MYSSANAFAGVLEYLIRRKYKQNVEVSRLFMYYNARKLDWDGATVGDYGASLTNTAKAIRLYGACEEELWPYDKRLVNVKPNPDAYRAACRFTIIPVNVPINVKGIKTSLAHGMPVAIGIVLRYSSGAVAKENQGYIPIPDLGAKTVLNSEMHSLVLVGYDDTTKHFIARNSWGEGWVK